MKKIEISEFQKIADIAIPKIIDARKENDSYLLSYPHFIDYFRSLKTIDKRAFFIGSNFTYGWMPTVLRYKTDKTGKADLNARLRLVISLLNRAKAEPDLSKAELGEIKGVINNSIVGTSKILHFINAEGYPIWDSKTCAYFTNNKNPSHANNIDRYLAYKKNCEQLVTEKGVVNIRNTINEILKPIGPVTRLRAIEMVFFNAT